MKMTLIGKVTDRASYIFTNYNSSKSKRNDAIHC